MLIPPRLFAYLCLSFCCCVTTIAQTPAEKTPPTKGNKSVGLTIAVAPTVHGVRFTALGAADKLRLEVYNPAGDLLFDTGLRAGSLLDWALTDAQGQTLPDSTYTCVLTAHDLAGALRVKQGSVTVQGGQALLELPDAGA